MAVFSDTTNKNGLIQRFEFWTRHSDGDVSGTLLKQVTDRLNVAFERIMPLLLMYSDNIRWDDPNHTDAPSGTFNIAANQNDYKFEEDDNSLDILNITHVGIKTEASDTVFRGLKRIKADDSRVPTILNPDTSVTGIPSGFLELGSRIYFDVLPNYTLANGGEIIFGREQEYFSASGDDTKEAGIPKPFHELLVLYAALDWNLVNRTEDVALIIRIEAQIKKIEANLKNFIASRNPTDLFITPKRISHR